MLGSLPPIRGISSYCLELSKAVASKCHVNFITYRDEKIYPSFLYPGGTATDFTFPEIKTNTLSVSDSLVWYNPLTWLKQAFSAKGDILHAQWWSLPLFPIYYIICLGFKLRKKPVVMTVHNVLPHEKSAIFCLASRLLFHLCDHLIVHTYINKGQLKRYYHIPQEHITVIPHGPLDFFYEHPANPMLNPSFDTKADIKGMKQRLGLPSGKKIILVFGAIRAYKGIDTALKAFVKLRKDIPHSNCHLLIAGKLWVDWESYQKLINAYNMADHLTVFHDYIPTDMVYQFFAVSDLVLLPYRHFDSQTGVGTLAAAFRKPMIVTNTGGLPELVRNRDMIVQPGDYKGLARSIALAVRDERMLKKMSEDAEAVAREISWEKISKKTMGIYFKVSGR